MMDLSARRFASVLAFSIAATTMAIGQGVSLIQHPAPGSTARPWPRLAEGGVPLPEDLRVHDASRLAVFGPGGEELPSQIHITARYPRGDKPGPGDARWVFVRTAEHAQALRLGLRPESAAPTAPLAQPGTRSWIAKVPDPQATESKIPPGILLGGWRLPTPPTAPRGHVALFLMDEGGKRRNFEIEESAIEARGPLRIVHRLRGRLGPRLRATVRLHQTHASPVIRFDVRLEGQGSWDPNSDSVTHFRALGLRFGLGFEAQTALDGVSPIPHPLPAQITLPDEGDGKTPRLPYTIEAGEKETRGRMHPGFVSISGRAQTLLLGRPRAALEAPVTWSLKKDRAYLWLLPPGGSGPFYGGRYGRPGKPGPDADPKSGKLYRFEGARWKTFTVFAALRPGMGLPEDLAALRQEANSPTLLSSTPEVHCHRATTGILLSPFREDGDDSRMRYQRWLEILARDDAADLRRSQGRIGIPGLLRRGGTYGGRNPFGWFNVGDIPWGAGFSSLHYDLPRSLFAAWLASGQRAFFDRGHYHALHQRDIDMIHEAEGARFRGAQRYEKGFFHGNFGKPHSSHHWITGLYLHYVCTGEEGSRETLDQAGDYLMRLGLRKWRGSYGARTLGWPLDNLLTLYHLTGDEQYRKAARSAIAAFEGHEGGRGYVLNPAAKGRRGGQGDMRGWQHSIVVSAICRYVDTTGDRSVLPLVRRICDHLMRHMVIRAVDGPQGFRRAMVREHWAPDRKHLKTQPGWYVLEALARAGHHLEDQELQAAAEELFRSAVRWTQVPAQEPRGWNDRKSWPLITALMSTFPTTEVKMLSKVGRHGMVYLHYRERAQAAPK